MGRAEKILSQGRVFRRVILIFITVGTHEQGMDRLFKQIDDLIESNQIKDEVFAQIGYTNYIPKNFKYQKMIGFDEMDEWIRKSDIIITHGGPGSIFHPLQYGKIPIVIPRNPDFKEHVDNHQILFAKRLEENKKILAVYEIEKIIDIIENYDSKIKKCLISKQNVEVFIKKLDDILYKKFKI